jgi:membrane fusion protein, copper/silver efflux system
MVNFTGEMVSKGQPLALIYSPELVTAQQELLETVKTKQSQPEIYEAAKEKLRQWKLTDKQIAEIENSGKVQANMEVESTASGIVTARRVNNGDYVSQGSVLYEVSDLSHVWILFDAYESDLPFLKKGDKVEFSIQALPGSAYSGTIMFIDPVIDTVNRVAKVRLEMSNPGAKLKPEMFATGIVKSNLAEYKDKLVIPRSAVLWTGKRSIVYVKQSGDEPVFKIREIELGPQLGNSYVVTDGLKDGEEIVTEGAFSVDAAAQLEGKPSMMNQEGGKKSSSMPGMDMSSGTDDTQQVTSSHLLSEQFKVSGNCEQCKDRIETAAKSVSGVSSADWNSETKMLHVQFDRAKTNSDAIQKAIAAVGHDTEKYKAPNAVYKSLPECCLYRK